MIPSSTVNMYAIGGTTSVFWNTDAGLHILVKMVRDNPKLSHLWVTLGGNDAIQMCARGRCDEYESTVLVNLRQLFKLIIQHKPDIKISSMGYDLLNWQRSVECMAQFHIFFPNTTMQEFNRQFIDRFTRIYSTLEKEFPKNVFFVPVWGELQRVGGIPNPPNVNFGSPTQFYSDCIHPNSKGYDILFTKFFKELKSRGYFQ